MQALCVWQVLRGRMKGPVVIFTPHLLAFVLCNGLRRSDSCRTTVQPMIEQFFIGRSGISRSTSELLRKGHVLQTFADTSTSVDIIAMTLDVIVFVVGVIVGLSSRTNTASNCYRVCYACPCPDKVLKILDSYNGFRTNDVTRKLRI